MNFRLKFFGFDKDTPLAKDLQLCKQRFDQVCCDIDEDQIIADVHACKVTTIATTKISFRTALY